MHKLLQKIIHTIVPHQKNNNIPHLLEESSITFLFLLVLGLFMLNSRSIEILRNLNLTATVYPAVLADLTNQGRLAEGLGSLNWNPTLAEAAQLKANDMIANGYFAHTSPSGVTPWHWLTELKYNFFYAGENLAIRFNESQDVQDAWLNSPTHKANIMNSKFSEIGIAAVDGVYQGRNTTFVVEYFGTPAVTVPITLPEKIETTPPVKQVPKILPAKTTTLTPKPIVAGVEKDNIPVFPVVPSAPVPEVDHNFTTLEDGNNFVLVQNSTPNIVPKASVVANSGNLKSSWYQRLVVNPSNALRSLYYLIIGAIMTSMALMLFKEYEHHHLKHFAMGLGMIAVLVCLIYFIPTTALFV